MDYDDIYTLKRYKKKKKQKNKLNKLLLLIVIILLVLIAFKKDGSLKDKIKNELNKTNFNFAKINKIYESIFGSVIPDVITKNEKEVFNEKLQYNNAKKFLDGASLTVKKNYSVPAQESGLVVYIGNKEGYGKTIIIQQVNGIDLWYGNINNPACKLYDYIEKGKIIGDTLNNDLYLVYKKEGTTLNYEEYIKS